MKKMLIALFIVAAMAASSMAAQVLAGGNIPLINNVVGVGVLTLDFSSAATTPVDIGNFIINCNADNFDVSWTFTNCAEFRKNATQAIVMSTLTIEPNPNQPSGAIKGAGIEILDPAVVSGVLVPTGGNIYAAARLGNGPVPVPVPVVWNPSNQTTATTNYAIIMRATWPSAATKLAGLYTESITFTIVATVL